MDNSYKVYGLISVRLKVHNRDKTLIKPNYMSLYKKWTTHLNFNPKMDNSSNLTPLKWTTHLIYYRGKKSLKLYINYI